MKWGTEPKPWQPNALCGPVTKAAKWKRWQNKKQFPEGKRMEHMFKAKQMSWEAHNGCSPVTLPAIGFPETPYQWTPFYKFEFLWVCFRSLKLNNPYKGAPWILVIVLLPNVSCLGFTPLFIWVPLPGRLSLAMLDIQGFKTTSSR